MGMRCTVALAVALIGLGLPAWAQRGAGHGGFAGHAGTASHGGFTSGARSGFTPRFGGGVRYGAAATRVPYGNSRIVAGPRIYAYGASTSRPVFYTRTAGLYPSSHSNAGVHGTPSFERGRDRFRPVFTPYGYPGYANFDWGYPFGDYGFGDDWDDDGDLSSAYTQPSAPYPEQPGDEGAYLAPAPFYAPQPQAPADAASQPEEEDAVTIVFKDGRPSEQIHNYALTRNALYIPGRHIREIPLDEIDLPATERVNRESGVDFQIPQAR